MFCIAVDIGATNIRLLPSVDFAFDNDLIKKYKFIERNDINDEVDRCLCDRIDELIKIHGSPNAICLSFPGNTDSEGTVLTWPNRQKWNGFMLRKYLSDKYKSTVIIEDDANCAAWGEYNVHSLNIRNMACITLGSGIGCGLILNGSIYKGDNGCAGELGHMYIGSGEKCTCGSNGCVQSIAGGKAIKMKYGRTFTEISNDERYLDIYHNIVMSISRAIYNMVMLLDIKMIIVGGGISNDKIVNELNKYTNELLNKFNRSVIVKKSLYGDNSGLYGILMILKKKFQYSKYD